MKNKSYLTYILYKLSLMILATTLPSQDIANYYIHYSHAGDTLAYPP